MAYEERTTETRGTPTHKLREITIKLTLGLEPGEPPLEHAQCWSDAIAMMAAWAAAQYEMLSGRTQMGVATDDDEKAKLAMGMIAYQIGHLRETLAEIGQRPSDEAIRDMIPQIQAAVAVEGKLQDVARLLACPALSRQPKLPLIEEMDCTHPTPAQPLIEERDITKDNDFALRERE